MLQWWHKHCLGLLNSKDIIRHQKASKGIKRHQKASKDIKRHKRHQKASKGIKRHQKASKGINRHQKTSKDIKRHQKTSIGIKRHQKTSKVKKCQKALIYQNEEKEGHPNEVHTRLKVQKNIQINETNMLQRWHRRCLTS